MTITKIFQTCAALVLVCGGAFASNGRVALARLPLTFETSSKGYLSHGEGFQARFSPTGVTLAFDADAAVNMRFPGANARPLLGVEDPQSHTSNYLTGADPRRWRTNVAQYGKLRYANLYPGVDLVFYGHRNLLEYDFIVRPGADPRSIAIEFHGARLVTVDPHGALTVATAVGELIHHKPVIYQERYGRRTTVEGRYALAAHNRVTFEIGAYDRTAPLIIDPVVQYSTYLGGTSPANSADDIAYAVALDSEDNIYVSGRTTARDSPLKGALQSENKGSGDAFVIKLDPTGQKILYSTYIGGGSLEHGYAIAVDAFGQAHVAGQTGSTDFPVKNAAQSRKTGLNNAFVAKLNAAGDGLVWSTFLGGDRNDQVNGIGLDSYGNVYVAGYTNSNGFPVKNALQGRIGGSSDGFISKLSPEGELLYSTYVGGPGQDEIYAMAVDRDGNAYVTGLILSPDMATTNAAQTRLLSRDAFVAKLIPDGSAFAYFTYLGGRGTDYGQTIAVDASGNAYVGGYTDSRDLPVTEGVFQPQISGNSDGFVAKINDLGSSIVWATYLGGSGRTNPPDEIVQSIAVDPDGCIYVTGTTISDDFPVTRAVQERRAGARDAFIAKITPAADKLIFSTFAGGTGNEDEMAIAVTPLRAFYVVGQTVSTDLQPLSLGCATR